jgi:prepilin-type N-terminal cleavage/methylation domain-containing protein
MFPVVAGAQKTTMISHRWGTKAMRRHLQNKAFSLVEIMVTVSIMAIALLPITATFIFVIRSHATAANQTQIRLKTQMVLEQLSADIRASSKGRYNALAANRVFTDGNIVRVTLLDPVDGMKMTWTYTKATGLLRRDLAHTVGIVTNNYSKTYDARFTDFTLTETLRDDTPWEITQGVEDNETITGIRVTGRAFLTLQPIHTVMREIDGNGDGSYAEDPVGFGLFGRTDEGDDPAWQHVFNVQISFRNT